MTTRIEFKLTPEEKARILEASKPVIMIHVGSWPATPQENANRVWEEIGRERGFDPYSVERVLGKDEDYFTAETKEPS